MSGFGRIAGLAPALAAAISLGHSADAQESARPLNCAIKPLKVIEVAAPIPGVLADVLVRPGQQVASGDVIARLDVDLETAELEAARVRADAEGAEKIAAARRSAAATQFSGAEQAFRNKVMSRMEYSRIRSDLTVADRELARAKEDRAIAASDVARMEILVSKGEIRAPEAGVIGEELLAASEAVEGRPIAQLIVTEPLRVEVFADGDTVEAVEAGEEFVLIAGGREPKELAVELDYISPIADPKSKVVKIFYNLRGASVRPGTQCFFAPKAAAERVKEMARGRKAG